MSKLKFFQICTVLLLVLNIALLAFGFINKPKGQIPFEKRIARDLSLDSEQEISFKELGRVHHEAISKINEDQKDKISQIFENLPKDISDDFDAIRKSICDLESDKIQLTYTHFVELHSLLNEEQKKSFKPVITGALQGILFNSKRDPRPPRDF